MVLSENDKRVYAAASTVPGAGRGLFARAPLKKGEELEVRGALVAAKSVSDSCTGYADVYKFRVGKYLLIPMGYGALMNHSNAPNMEKAIKGRRVFLRALRPIARGEELFFRYSAFAQRQFTRRRNHHPPRGG